MRRSFLPLALFFVLTACNAAADKSKTNAAAADSSSYITPSDSISPDEQAQYNKKLSDFFDTNLLNSRFNGGILVAKDGHILYEHYAGYKDPVGKIDPVNEHTAFHLASSSKPFTGTAILRLVQAGKVHLGDDITTYFPGFPYPGITVQNLLSHRSGLPNYLYEMEDKSKWDPKRMVTNKDVLDFLIKYKPGASFRPGTHFSYCNTNFVLLALIIEKVTGTPYPQYMKQTIFGPLKMDDTFVFTPADSGKVIMSYMPNGRMWANDKYEYTYGDKNIYSTPRDMMKWDRGLYNNNFIRQSLLDSAYQPQSHEKPSVHNYGLGWRMLLLPNGKKVIYHFGKWHGFTPAFGRLLDEKAVVIILGNNSNKSMYKAAKNAYAIFGDYVGTFASEEGEQAPPTGPAAEPQPAPVKPKPTTTPRHVNKPATVKKTTGTKHSKPVATNKKTVPPQRAKSAAPNKKNLVHKKVETKKKGR